MDRMEKRMQRLGWRVTEFAESMGVSRSKAYEILAAHPELTIRVGASLRVVPERAREWRDQLSRERIEQTA
jgi:plasmid maintenance system antidote protein VapI